MKFLLVMVFLISNMVLADESSDRNKVINESKRLLLSKEYGKLTQISQKYLDNEMRTKSGRWKLDLFYTGIGKTVKNTDFDTLEKIALDWINSYPKSKAAYISYAKILVLKGWYSRGSRLGKYVSQTNWDDFKKYMKKARNFLNKHKKFIVSDPGWYVLMLDIAKAESWNKTDFFKLFDEAISKHPYYNPIYFGALYRMDPRWGSFSKEEVEKIAQKILVATKEKARNSRYARYARFYWVASQLIYKKGLFSKSDVDWTIMSKGIDDILEEFPTQYNINHFAYYSCMARDKNKTKYLFAQIKNKLNGRPWTYGNNIYNKCQEWANSSDGNNTNIKYVKEVSLHKLDSYIKNNTHQKPVFIHFSSYKKGCVDCDIQMLEKIAEKYHEKINFISINVADSTSLDRRELFYKYRMKQDPYSMIIEKNKIIQRRDNSVFFNYPQLNKYRPDRIENVIKIYLSGRKPIGYFDQFKEKIVDKASFFNSEENIRDSMDDAYLKLGHKYKAVAAAVNYRDDIWVHSRILNASSQEEANKQALVKCEEKPDKDKVKDDCKLHMIDDIYVYEKTEEEIKRIMNDLSKMSNHNMKQKLNLNKSSENIKPIVNRFKNIPLNDIKKYIMTNSSKKPQYIYFKRKGQKIRHNTLELAKSYIGKVDFLEVDINAPQNILTSDLEEYFHLKSFPCMVVIFKNKILLTHRGNYGVNAIKTIIEKIKYNLNQILNNLNNEEYLSKFGTKVILL